MIVPSSSIAKFLLPLLLLISFTASSQSQKKKSGGKSSGKSSASSYNWGIGVKLGDPLGLSIKKYNGNNAFEFIVGRSFYWGDYDYYYWTRHSQYYRGYYKGYYIDNVYDWTYPVAFQLRYLIHKPIKGLDELKWYIGPGIQVRYSTYYYSYWSEDRYRYYVDGKYTDIGVGLDGVAGLEYTFKDAPISIGLDINLYLEIFDRFFYPLGQGGVAVRYNF